MNDFSNAILNHLRSLDVEDDQAQKVQVELEERGGAAIEALRRCFHDGVIGESNFQAVLAEALALPLRTTIDTEEVNPQFIDLVPISFVRRFRVIALQSKDGCVPIITDDIRDLAAIDFVGACLRMPTTLELAPAAVVEQTINLAYSGKESNFSQVLDEVDSQEDVDSMCLVEDGDLLDNQSRAPVVKLVSMALFEAVKCRASDVHIQPSASHVQIRYRIDGVLYDHLELPLSLLDEVISRIKVIGRMDIAEKRLAQDGRTTVTIGDRVIDLRISIIPTSHGERAVLRLLDKSARLYTLGELGMSAHTQQVFEQLIQKTHGIVLVTGPTGSGKSTTLYAALQYLDCTERNILTLEDPIEYQLPGISQTQVSSKKGMTFATGLRAVLRQDPDIIMVGEIRDEETARMAVQSSLTGHLVFSTLHTNNAAGAVSRLSDLGIEAYLVASSLVGSLAQRLVRVICPECSVDVAISGQDIRQHQLDPSLSGRWVKSARGCEACGNTGYCGRRGVFELMPIDETIRELIVNRANTTAIETRAVENRMATLRQDAVRKLLEGDTTIEEVARVTHQDTCSDGELVGYDVADNLT